MQNPSLGQHHKTEKIMFFPQRKMVCFSGEFLPSGEFFFFKMAPKKKLFLQGYFSRQISIFYNLKKNCQILYQSPLSSQNIQIDFFKKEKKRKKRRRKREKTKKLLGNVVLQPKWQSSTGTCSQIWLQAKYFQKLKNISIFLATFLKLVQKSGEFS